MEKKHNKTTSSRVAAATLAAQQHLSVREFLNQDPMRTDLLADLGQGRELTLLEELLEMKKPVTAQYLKLKHNMVSATASMAAEYISGYLTDFSANIEPLKVRHIVISIPRSAGGVHVGYHFACFDTNMDEYLDGPATKELFEDIWPDFIEDRLRETLKEEGRYWLSKKLKGRDDYQALDMETGTVEEKPRQDGITTEFQQTRVCDHNRAWEPFSIDSLLEPEGAYIVSVDAGRGKTTFLRYLQVELLERTSLIPIFLDASEIELWESKNLRQFTRELAEGFDLQLYEDKIVDFIEKCLIRKKLVLLVDGLDQIRGGGNEYARLANHILDLTKNNVIIASRPSAVIQLENEKDFTFLRLKPFDMNSQELYFGDHYKRASGLSLNAPDLIAVPMLAYMVRTLVEKTDAEDARCDADLYKGFIDYILKGYKHGAFELPLDLRNEIRVNLQRISYDALREEEPYMQKIPLEYYARKYHNHELTIRAEEFVDGGAKMSHLAGG